MSWLGAIVTPETEYLRAQRKAIDTNLADEERLAGSAIQESREDLKKRLRAARDLAGSWGGSSTDMYQLLSGMEAGQRAEENEISQGTAADQAAAARTRREIDLLIPIRQAQETYQAGKDILTSVTEGGGIIGGLPDLAGGAAAAGGNDVGNAMTAAQGSQESRYLARQQVARPGLGAGQAAGQAAGNQARIDRLRALLQMNPGDAGILAQLAQLGVVL